MSPAARLLRTIRRVPPVAGVWALTTFVAGLALGLWLALDAGAAGPGVRVPWWLLAAGFVVTELCVVHLHFRRSAYTLTLGELPLVVGLVYTAPRHLAVAWILGAGVVLLRDRCPPTRLVFNLAQLGLTASLAAAVFAALDGGGGPLDPATWAAVAAAAVVADAASSLLIALAMAVSGERVTARRVPRLLAVGVGAGAVNVGLGLGVVALIAAKPLAAVLLAGPAAAVFLAYRAYQSERTQNLGLEFLYDASRALSGAADRASGVAGVLRLATETFRAETAEVCVAGDGTSPPRRVTVGPHDRVEALEALDEEVAADLLACVEADAGARLVSPEDVGPALAAHLASLGVRTAMLAGLSGDRGVVGGVIVGNRVGVGGTFDEHDLRLFGTLSGHLGAALGQELLSRRVSELHEAQAELYHQASHDSLTGLANRMLFMDRVGNALARRTGNAAVIYIDLNDFKPVNDTFGHEAGDEVLRVTADRLRTTLRPADTPARLGGDEFAVLLTDIREQDVGIVADRVLRAFAEPFDLCGREHAISASVGIAVGDAGTVEADELLRNADAAMYVRKHGDKRGYSVYGAVPAA